MNVSTLLIRLARLTAPDHRADWLHAMQAELDHIPVSQRRSFAWGCLQTSVQERIKNMTRIPPLRIVPGLIIAAMFSVVCLATGLSLFSSTPVIGGTLIVAGTLWIAVYSAVHAQSSERLAKFAVAGLAFYAAIGLASLAGAPAFTGNAAFFGALSLEGIILFTTVLIIAHIPFFWESAKAAD